MVVQANLLAMNSDRMLGLTTGKLAKKTEKLSSGYRVNRAADDAAGLAISEKMRRQIRGLSQAVRNTQDGISFCQIADGALNEVHDMLKRCQQLATQSANATNTDTDRQYLQMEAAAIQEEIDRVHQTSVFNEMRVFTDAGLVAGEDGSAQKAAPAEGLRDSVTMELGDGMTVTLGFVGSANEKADVAATSTYGTTNSATVQNSELADFVLKAAQDAVSKLASTYSGLFQKAGTAETKLGLELGSIDGSGNTLAYVAMTTWLDGSSVAYTMKVDTDDYPTTGPATEGQKAKLAATIAHELTHLFMDDTLTAGMMSGRTTSFPGWFIEGTAQTSSGDNGWVVGQNILSSGQKQLNVSSTDADIKAYMATLSSSTNVGKYGAGYLASMYLGYLAGGGNMNNIGSGLDSLLSDIASGDGDSFKTLNQAIAGNDAIPYTGLADFETKFRGGDESALQFIKDLLAARGATRENISSGDVGVGSALTGGLTATEVSFFSSPSGTSTAYQVEKGNTSIKNTYSGAMTIPERGAIDGSSGDGGVGNDRAGFHLQVGAESGQYIYVDQFNASADVLLQGRIDISTIDGAESAIDTIKKADARVSTIRSYYGAMQNRLEHTVNNLNNVVENTTAAESQIRDADMADEMVDYSNLTILQSAGSSMLAQSNQRNQLVLSLLQ